MYKYVHLMFNDKFNKPIVDFLNKYFDPKEHLFLCKRFFKEFPFPVGPNVLEIQSLKQIKWNELNFEKIICHSLFDNEVVDFLYTHKEYLKKAYWLMWGADYYHYVQDEKNIYVRENFKGYISNSDAEELSTKFNKEIIPLRLILNFPIKSNFLKNCNIVKNENCVIQVNNSCDKSTLEIFAYLKLFANEKIRVRTILSYGDLSCKEIVIQKGREYFGDKFEYLDRILSPKYYAAYLAENDILILNQNRSQGFGNTIASLYLGKKIFIRKDVSTFPRLVRDGFFIYDTTSIKNLSFDEFVLNEHVEDNKKLVTKWFDEDYIKKQWEVILAS